MSKHQVLICDESGNFEKDLNALVRDLGYETELTRSYDSIFKIAEDLTNPILIVYLGEDEDTCVEAASELIKREELHLTPLVCVGYQVDDICSILERYFALVSTVPLPCDESDVFRALADIDRRYHEVLARVSPSTATDDEPGLLEQDDIQGVYKPIEPPAVDRTAPEELFEQLDTFRPDDVYLEGGSYSAEIGKDFLEARGYYPCNEATRPAVDEVMNDASTWGKNHLCRTAFISGKLIEILGINDALAENARCAVFLYSMALKDNEDLLRKNYCASDTESFRKEVCSKIKDSAYRIAVELRAPEIGEIVAKLGRLIGGEEASQDDEVSIVTSIIMGAELLDRICFSTGQWDPRAAYHLMRKLKQGFMNELHPLVWGCLIKFLSEAITQQTRIVVLPKELRTDPELFKKAMENRNMPVGEEEQRVEIANLTPGMRLTQPLFAFDGRKVLSENVKLDRDLVWRIWQLSAVRPLNPPIVLDNDKKSKSEKQLDTDSEG